MEFFFFVYFSHWFSSTIVWHWWLLIHAQFAIYQFITVKLMHLSNNDRITWYCSPDELIENCSVRKCDYFVIEFNLLDIARLPNKFQCKWIFVWLKFIAALWNETDCRKLSWKLGFNAYWTLNPSTHTHNYLRTFQWKREMTDQK